MFFSASLCQTQGLPNCAQPGQKSEPLLLGGPPVFALPLSTLLHLCRTNLLLSLRSSVPFTVDDTNINQKRGFSRVLGLKSVCKIRGSR